jgi:DNA invertase Pin-like site-specific DNA recombinase
VELPSVTGGIDTTTPAGRFLFLIMASLARMHRELPAEPTRAGRDEARQRGPDRRPQAADDAGESGCCQDAP